MSAAWKNREYPAPSRKRRADAYGPHQLIDITLLVFFLELSILAATGIYAAAPSGQAGKAPRVAARYVQSEPIHFRLRSGICQTTKCYYFSGSHQGTLQKSRVADKGLVLKEKSPGKAKALRLSIKRHADPTAPHKTRMKCYQLLTPASAPSSAPFRQNSPVHSRPDRISHSSSCRPRSSAPDGNPGDCPVAARYPCRHPHSAKHIN